MATTKKKAANTVVVSVLPKCGFCAATATVDGKTGFGGWANMCKVHHLVFGVGLGLGKGQRLVLASSSEGA